MGQATEPSVEEAWDSWTSGEQPEAAVETEPEPIDELAAETTDDTDDTTETDSTDDYQDLRAEMSALKQQFEQERLQYQELLRRAQQSMRSVGDSIVERVEQRLAQAQPALVNLVKQNLLTPEDAQAQMNALRGQFTSEEAQRSLQERSHAQYQAWLEQRGQPQPQQNDQWAQMVQQANAQIDAMLVQSKLTAEDLRAAGVPTDFSHLSPVEAPQKVREWLVAAIRYKKANGSKPNGNGSRQFPMGDMGGGAGVGARSLEAITAELHTANEKAARTGADSDWQRVQELSAALDKYLATN